MRVLGWLKDEPVAVIALIVLGCVIIAGAVMGLPHLVVGGIKRLHERRLRRTLGPEPVGPLRADPERLEATLDVVGPAHGVAFEREPDNRRSLAHA